MNCSQSLACPAPRDLRIKRGLFTYALFCLLLISTGLSHASGLFSSTPRQGEFLPVDQAFIPSVLAEDGDLVLHFAVTPGHYLYDKQFQLKWADGSIAPMLPAHTISSPGESHDDPTFGRVTVYREDIDLTIPAPAHDTTGIVELLVRYQGCADAGLCYPPEVWRVPVDLARWQPDLSSSATQVSTPAVIQQAQASFENLQPQGVAPSTAPDATNANALAQWLATASFPVVLGMFLLLGLGLAFTPCVLPMLPILSAIIAGQKTPTARQGFLLALSYVLGMSVMYTIAGLLIASLGAAANISALLQKPAVLISFALIFIALAIMLWQGRAIALPQAWQDKLNQAQQQQRGGVYGSVFVMGAISSVIVSPCVSAPLAGVMLFLSTSQDAVLGGSALFALSLGMGLPLLVLGAGGARLIPKAGGWMDNVKRLFAWGLLAVAALVLLRLVSPAQAQIGWGVFFGLSALGLVSIGSQRRLLALLLATIMMFYAGSLVWSGAQGGHQLLKPWQLPAKAVQNGNGEDALGFVRVSERADLNSLIAEAKAKGQPVIVDVYADWCVSCIEMENDVIAKPSIQALLKPAKRIKFDITATTADQLAWMSENNLFGPPAYLLWDAAGTPQDNLVGATSLDNFAAHLERVWN